MTFQSTVALDQGFGVPGELYLDGPTRGQPGTIDSAGPNTVGFVFTKVAGVGNDGHCIVGGAIGEGTPFFGILANPKVYPLFGTTGGGTLAASLNLPQYAQGEFVQETSGIIVNLTNGGNVGDRVDYDPTTGALYGRASGNSFHGIIAVTTGVLTVTGFVAGGAPIQVGAPLTGPLVPPGTYITGLGSGTGGNGTYNTNLVTAVAGADGYSSGSLPAAGHAEVPGARVTRYSTDATGLAVISIAVNGGN